jgi:hypothetical protein
MQYLVSVIDDRTTAATSDQMTAINIFNDRFKTDGYLVFAAGWQHLRRQLLSTTAAKRRC